MGQNFRCLLRHFKSDASGNIAFIYGIIAIPLLSMVGIAVDYSNAVAMKSHIQQAADAAVLAGSSHVGEDAAEKEAVAEAYFLANYNDTKYGTVTPDITVNDNEVTLTVDTQKPLAFAGIFKAASVDVSVTAVADGDGVGKLCLLALNNSIQGGLDLSGNGNLQAVGCVIQVNSNHTEAIEATGSSSGTAISFCAVGGENASGNLSPSAHTGCDRVDDPYVDLVLPTVTSCDHTALNLASGAHALTPGTYCGGLNLQANADATLAPGVYIIKDGPLTLSASASLVGEEVLFFFTGTNTKMEVNGGANIDITAPTDGDWKGFAFIQDPLSNPGETSKIQGGGIIEFEGALYTPTWIIELSGNGTMSDDADTWIMVADRFIVKGNSNMYLRANAANDDMDKVVVSIAAKVHLTK